MKKTNLKKRIIPIILIENLQVVSTKNFNDSRVFGNVEQTIEVFSRRDVDEIIVLDISCTKNNYSFDTKILKMISKNTMMPFAYGGGIKTLADIEKCLKNGCDKVVINNYIRKNDNFLSNAINEFGKQAITVSMDYYSKNNKYYIYDHAISKKTNIKLFDYLKSINKVGCGEIIVTSIDADGLLKGYNLNPIKTIRNIVDFPIIVNGGCGSPEHMLKAFKSEADACGAGSIFYHTQNSYGDVKNYLKKNKVNVR